MEDPSVNTEALRLPMEKALTVIEESKIESSNERRLTKYLAPSISNNLKFISAKSEAIYQSRFKEFSGSVKVKIQGRMRRRWRNYYISVKDKILKLFKELSSKQPVLSINFDCASCEISVVQNKLLEISPKSFSKSLLIDPLNEESLEDLCITLNSNVTASVGYNVNLVELCEHSRKFWKKSYISRTQFFDLAENGDLMLFKSSSFGSFALRVASNSEYDHVGMLIRGKKGEVFLYECLGAGGVQLNDIEFFLDNDWDSYYRHIAIRKLHCERSEEFMTNFRKCCSKYLGRPYKISAEKLMRKTSIRGEKENFFCSELIAAVYKEVGLLPQGLSSCQYWPNSFSVSQDLQLINGSLGEEMRIIFNQ